MKEIITNVMKGIYGIYCSLDKGSLYKYADLPKSLFNIILVCFLRNKEKQNIFYIEKQKLFTYFFFFFFVNE